MPPETSSRITRTGLLILMALGAGALVWAIVRTAWLCDDAYITFRVVDNFWHGYGLRWNVAERVQPYTHPLWLMVLCAVFPLTRELYFTPLLLNIGLSLVAVGLLIPAWLRRPWVGAFCLFALAFSQAFVDFCTSGMENPLAYLLAALFFLLYFRDHGARPRIFALSLILGLISLTRMDLLVLFGPAWFEAFLRTRSWKNLAWAAAGLVPVALWEIFSTVYYGFPFPNTAYAKLATGIPAARLAVEGIHYLSYTAFYDRVTFPITALALVAVVARRDRREILLFLGILLYDTYIVIIGGDFMIGRFLAVPFFVAVLLLSRVDTVFGQRWVWVPALAALVIAGFASPMQTVRDPLTDASYPEGCVKRELKTFYHGTALLEAFHGGRMPSHFLAENGRALRAKGRGGVETIFSAGFYPFFGGPGIFFLDLCALTDPLLARLPAKEKENIFIGHFLRVVPEGYVETIRSGENRIKDPKTAALYSKISLVTRGPLFSLERFHAMAELNLPDLLRCSGQ